MRVIDKDIILALLYSKYNSGILKIHVSVAHSSKELVARPMYRSLYYFIVIIIDMIRDKKITNSLRK